MPYGASKIMEFDQGTNIATVYHSGKYSCDLKLQKDVHVHDMVLMALKGWNT